MEDNGKQEETPAEKILAFLDESSTSRPKKKSELIVILLRQVAQKLSSIQITEKQSKLEEILIQSSQKMIQLPISGLKYFDFYFFYVFIFIYIKDVRSVSQHELCSFENRFKSTIMSV